MGRRWSAGRAARMTGGSTRRARRSRSARRPPSTADLTHAADLQAHLWRLAEKLARRLKEHELAAGGVVLKLKTSDFAIRTRAARLPGPTVLPDRLFEAAGALLVREATGTAFRLIGIGASPLVPLTAADHGDLADTETLRRAATQAAIDALRQRFGETAISRGRGWTRPPPPDQTGPDQASGGAAAIGMSLDFRLVAGAGRTGLAVLALGGRRAAVFADRDDVGRPAAGRSAGSAARPGSSRSGCGNSARRAGSSFPPSRDRRRWSHRGQAAGISRTAAATCRGHGYPGRCCRRRGCG